MNREEEMKRLIQRDKDTNRHIKENKRRMREKRGKQKHYF
jgi:hypothetical protein